MDLKRLAVLGLVALPATVAPLAVGGCELQDAFAPARKRYEGLEITGNASPMETEAKLALYLRCQDSLVDMLEDSWSRLNAQVDERGRLKRRRRLYVYAVPRSLFRVCDQTLREGPEMPPAMPEIERSATDMVEAAKAFAELTRELEGYLESGGLGQDDGAKVQVLYPLLVRAHAQWRRSDRILSLNLNASKLNNDPELLAQLAAAGRDVEYHARAIMIRARHVMRCATEPDQAELDCEEELEAFADTYDEFEQFYAAERERADRVFWMRTYGEDVEEFRELVVELSGDMDGRGSVDRLSERDEAELIDSYRRLFRDAQTLNFDFPG